MSLLQIICRLIEKNNYEIDYDIPTEINYSQETDYISLWLTIGKISSNFKHKLISL